MENTKHTPGPWAIRYGGGIDMRIIAEDFGIVCDIEGPQTTDLMDEYEDVFLANAKLIAAAPELLEALVRAVDEMAFLLSEVTKVHPGSYSACRTIQDCKSAIKKATE